MMVDSGAERSALSPAAAARCGLSPLLDTSFTSRVGGVGSAKGHGRVHYATVAFPDARGGGGGCGGGAVFEVGFDVFDWPAPDFDGILGLDFLSRYGAVLDLSGLSGTARGPPNGALTLAAPSALAAHGRAVRADSAAAGDQGGRVVVPLAFSGAHDAADAA